MPVVRAVASGEKKKIIKLSAAGGSISEDEPRFDRGQKLVFDDLVLELRAVRLVRIAFRFHVFNLNVLF